MSTRPAAFTAATSVVWSFEFTAFWMMFFDGYIGAPPTLTVFSDIVSAANAAGATAAKARKAALANKAKRLDMMASMLQNGVRRRTAEGTIACVSVVAARYGGPVLRFHSRSHARVNGCGATRTAG